MSYRNLEAARFVYLAVTFFILAAGTLLGGCGSDGPSGPNEPVGKYPPAGTATVDDGQDVGTNAGIKLTVLQTGSPVASAITGADGSFALPALANGDYALKASLKFYSTVTRDIQVRDSLLVSPIGTIELERTFFVFLRTDSLNYTFKSDSVYTWIVLKNENAEGLDLFNPLAYPYDIVVFESVEAEEEIWLWSPYRPPVPLPPRNKYEAYISAMDSLVIIPAGPVRAWGKSYQEGTKVPPDYYEMEARIELLDDRNVVRPFKSERHVVRLVP